MALAKIICYFFNAIIAFITICLIFIYIKSKVLHSYPCYFNILLASVISLDNILRLIPFYNRKNNNSPNDSGGCKFQGFTLAFLDKFMLTTMTIYSIISFLGLVKFNFYKKYEKWIFIILIIIGFLLSLIMAILFILNGVTSYDDVCYVRYQKEDNEPDIKINKVVTDTIVTFILFFINIYCIIRLLFYIHKIIRESEINIENNNEKKNIKKYSYYFWNYFIDFLLTSLTFIMVILIILDKFFDNDNVISLSYVILSLLIVIFFTINRRVLKEGKKIILCKDNEKNKNKQNNDDEDNGEDGIDINDKLEQMELQ